MRNWLKNILIAGFLAVPGPLAADTPTAAQPAATPSHAHGVHGMVLFGEPGRVFASHLPLYRHPHDWQVVLEVLPVGTAAQQLIDERLATDGLLTVEPERFDLWRLKPGASEPLRQFKGALFSGHFERGGEKLRDIDWQVKRVWVFEPVRIELRPVTGHRYFQIGSEERGQNGKFWLLHKVDRVPDTDQIVEVCTAEKWQPGLFTSAALLEPQQERLDNCNESPLRRIRVLWQDSDDLQ